MLCRPSASAAPEAPAAEPAPEQSLASEAPSRSANLAAMYSGDVSSCTAKSVVPSGRYGATWSGVKPNFFDVAWASAEVCVLCRAVEANECA